MMSSTLRFILNQPLKQWLREREKEGKMEIQIFVYLENKNKFLHETKHIFNSF